MIISITSIYTVKGEPTIKTDCGISAFSGILIEKMLIIYQQKSRNKVLYIFPYSEN